MRWLSETRCAMRECVRDRECEFDSVCELVTVSDSAQRATFGTLSFGARRTRDARAREARDRPVVFTLINRSDKAINKG